MEKESDFSKKTIYTYIYVFCKGELKKELKFNKEQYFSRGKSSLIIDIEII